MGGPRRQRASEILCENTERFQRERIVTVLAGLYRRYPDWNGLWFGTNPLAGLPPTRTKDWDRTAMTSVLEGLRTALKDNAANVRGKAIAGLREVGPPAASALRDQLKLETNESNLIGLVECSARSPTSNPRRY